MIKHEIRVEFSNSEALKSIIQKAYFDEGYMGKILGKVKTGSNRYHRTMRRHIRQKPAGFWDSTAIRLTATQQGSRQPK
jgi:hypothetical protein